MPKKQPLYPHILKSRQSKPDEWDVAIFEKWLRLAREKGTDVIKVRLAEDFGAQPGWVQYTVEVSAKEVEPWSGR